MAVTYPCYWQKKDNKEPWYWMWMILDDVTVAGLGNAFKITHIKRKETIDAIHLPG